MKKYKAMVFITIFSILPIVSFCQNNLLQMYPKLGNKPHITDQDVKDFQKKKQIWNKVDSIVSSFDSYEDAKLHLTKEQIEIYENEDFANRIDNLDVDIYGCSWYCGGGPDSIFASSVLPDYKNISYDPNNTHDFYLGTAWVEGENGYGIGESITFRFAKNSPPVTTVFIYNGYQKSYKAWKDNSRVKQLKLYINNKPYAVLNLVDTISLQEFDINSHQGIKNDLYLKFEIKSVYKGDKYDDVAISEIEFTGTGVHCFAKGTQILLPDGKTKSIENVIIGDTIVSYNEKFNCFENSVVEEVAGTKHHNVYEFDFEGIKIRATDDHPFYYAGKYYSLIANSKYGISTEVLKTGQKIAFWNENKIEFRTLTKVDKIEDCVETYTILKLSKNNIFIANGFLVFVESVEVAE